MDFSTSGLCLAFKIFFGLFSIFLAFRCLEYSTSFKFELFWSNFANKTVFAESFAAWISVYSRSWIFQLGITFCSVFQHAELEFKSEITGLHYYSNNYWALCYFSKNHILLFEAIIVEGQTNPCDVTVLPFVELSIKNPPINIDALNKAVLISVKANPSLRSFFEETPETQTKVGRFQVSMCPLFQLIHEQE